jgi:dTDP-4-dehydrorhamnose 3,5-epimerase
MNLIVPVGLVAFVFCDEDNQFRRELIGSESYSRITVPPGFWFGFQGASDSPSLILNISNILHHPDEVKRIPASEIVYDWNLQ